MPESTSTALSTGRLPAEMKVEAAITVGGGWGAENVGNRKITSPAQPDGHNTLTLRGTITEPIRSIVGTASSLWSGVNNGYKKNYHLDKRLLQGILPSDFSMVGKYIPAPGGWRDY